MLHVSQRPQKGSQSFQSETLQGVTNLPPYFRKKIQASNPSITVQSTLRKKISQAEIDEMILGKLELLDSPRALTVWMLYNCNEHMQLLALVSDPSAFVGNLKSFIPHRGIDGFRAYHAATKFLSKYKGLNPGINTERVAIMSAATAENLCYKTNQRFRDFSSTPLDVSLKAQPSIMKAAQIIAKILGPVPSSFEESGWSPGRTSSAYGDCLSKVHKYLSPLDCSSYALSSALSAVQSSPLWGAAVLKADGPVSVLERAFTRIKGNTLITVPKNAKTDRSICYEPHMNVWLQLAVGSYLKKRLLKNGINLRDQSINQRRAKFGSKFGSLATIDLSMASDTMCRELVLALLPFEWFSVLDDLRSHYTFWPDGEWRENNKFSSMGNGFTFELESLIFYALCSAESKNVSVYGDDIIIPVENFDKVKTLLEFCGFALNESKSFASGHFRESCGGDYFCGVDCTPVYLKDIPNNLEGVIKTHNAIRNFWSRAAMPAREVLSFLVKLRDNHPFYCGPSGYGDGHYHVDFDELAPSRAAHGLDGWWFTTASRVAKVNSNYGDRVLGRYSSEFGFGALCATLGPKHVRDVVSNGADRRQFTYKKTRVLANSHWPTIIWF